MAGDILGYMWIIEAYAFIVCLILPLMLRISISRTIDLFWIIHVKATLEELIIVNRSLFPASASPNLEQHYPSF